MMGLSDEDALAEIAPETWARMADAVKQVNQAMRQWADANMSAFAQLARVLAACEPSGDPDEPLWFDAMRPDPDAEVWTP